MSEFRNLPQSFIAQQNDELLLATPTEATRISVKSLKYDALATLKFKHPGDQNYGIGTADTWAKVPFNELILTGVNQWVQLNADGSFSLAEGYYFLKAEATLVLTNQARFSLRRNSDFLEVVKTSAINDSTLAPRAFCQLSKKFPSTGETFSVEISVNNPSSVSLSVADLFLAGVQVTLCSCEIHKLG